MEDSNDLRKKVAANLRSVTQSCKGGVPFECLERDYRDLLGVPIPYKALGYSSLEAMLKAMPDVVTLEKNLAGKCIVMAVTDETTAHIASLIARQKSAVRKPVRSKRPLRVRRAPAASQRPTSSVRHFNKGSRAPPSYLESDFQAHSHSSSLDHFQEPTRSIPPHNTEPLVHSQRQKAAPPTTFGPKYEIPPRFLRKQEKPLTSLENNSTDEHLSLVTTASFNYGNRQPVVDRTVTSAGGDAYLSPPAYKSERTIYESPRSAREFIENYAQKNKLECNYHTVAMGQRQKTYVSVLSLGPEKFRNYPDGQPTPEKAEEAVAEIAKKAISQREDLHEVHPVVAIDEPHLLDQMLNKIDQIVAEKPKGIWNYSIPTVYEQKYEERLPEEWFSVVKQYCSFYFTKVDDSRVILYPGSDSGRASPASNVSNQDDDNVSEDFENKLNITVPLLQFPTENSFPVFVTNVQDAQCIAVRLVDYVDEFSELSEQMKKFYSENKCPVTNVAYDAVYAVLFMDLWHRALVEEVKGDVVSCQLVDEGDVVEVSRDSLQEINPSFVSKVPFQAAYFKLEQLEAFSLFVNVDTLKHYLLGKSLIAHLNDSNASSVVLYDTSTDEDVNLNRIIFEKTVAESLNYTLPECGYSAVGYISHVSSCGTVYLTFNSPSTTNLLLEELRRITPACTENAKQGCDISKTSIYCAKYDSDEIWYRAIIIDTALGKGEVEVLYVDYGNTSWVPLSSVCELKPVSEYLSELPFQAIQCNLSELPPRNRYWSDKAIQRLGELAPFDKDLIVRVQKQGSEKELPEVALFIRNEQSQIVSINQTLDFDKHLFGQSPSGKHDRLPSWTKGFHSEFNKKEYTPPHSSLQRAHMSPSPAVLENATNGQSSQGSLSNLIPDVAVSAEQQLAKRHGNWGITSKTSGNDGDSETEQFPPLYPPDVPDVGEYFNVFVTMAASPFNFMCQPLKSSGDLDQLLSEMQSFYSNEENLCEMHSVLVRQGEFFAGKHVDGCWYRVRKQSIVSEDPLEVSVYYVDFGDMCILPLPNLQPLFKQFKSLPCQCMKASLKGVRPNGHDWDPMECFEFKKMVEEKNFASVIKNKELKVEPHMTIYSLELVLVDVSDPKVDVYIHDALIKNKIGQPAK